MFKLGWLLYAMISLVTWGLWGFLGKVASRSMSGEGLVLISSAGWIATFPIFLAAFRSHLRPAFSSGDVLWGLLGGMVGSLGMLFFYFALERGETSRVVAITAAYPLVTALLAFWVLGEEFTVQKGIGLVFALIGIIFLSR